MAQEVISHPPSRNIASIMYDADTQTLTVQFLSGYVYNYYRVDETTALGFQNALSANQYLKTFIANSFPSERL
jgi:hypothetical protein